MHTLAFSTFLVVITCAVFGSLSGDGRFVVPYSNFSFFSNSNELALQLVFGIIFLIFPFFERRTPWKLLAFFLIPAAGMYTLQTGSRGVLIASIVVGLTLLFLSRNKGKLIGSMAFIILIALVAAPPEVRQRLMSVTLNPAADATTDENVQSAIASQKQREDIFWQSVDMTLRHPVFGVGPGEFAAAQFGAVTGRGQWAPWIGTHNSYTQVSSESGFPGLIFYVATICICLRMNYKLYRHCSVREELEEHAGISFCMLLGTILYAVSTVFFHIAYGGFLPAIAGLTTATYLATRRDAAGLEAPTPASTE
jgi:O-antigen ligase